MNGGILKRLADLEAASGANDPTYKIEYSDGSAATVSGHGLIIEALRQNKDRETGTAYKPIKTIFYRPKTIDTVKLALALFRGLEEALPQLVEVNA